MLRGETKDADQYSRKLSISNDIMQCCFFVSTQLMLMIRVAAALILTLVNVCGREPLRTQSSELVFNNRQIVRAWRISGKQCAVIAGIQRIAKGQESACKDTEHVRA